jgi:hypothetical protein
LPLYSPTLSERALASDPADAAVFRKILRTIVSFVMIKLSSKGPLIRFVRRPRPLLTPLRYLQASSRTR